MEVTIQTPEEMQNLINELNDHELLELLLQDHTTNRNILWQPGDEMQLSQITGEAPERPVIPRWMKSKEAKKDRAAKKAEVYTPGWIVDNMIDTVFSQDEYLADGKKYLNDTFLEITCGEGAFITTRYDMDSGKPIPIGERCGVLDRKFRWLYGHAPIWEYKSGAYRALETTYGYEWQGDSLLLARINVLLDYIEYFELLAGRMPGIFEIRFAIPIITWNLWQMDGLKGTVPGMEQKAVIMDWSNRRQCYFDRKMNEGDDD